MSVTALLQGAERVQRAAQGPPTTEIGQIGMQSQVAAIPSWSVLVDQAERTPELRWTGGRTGATAVYQDMRNDSQVDALLSAVWLPIRRRRWLIDPNGAREEIVTGLSEDFGLAIKGRDAQPQGRSRDRFSWDQHLFHVLLALVYGHYFFEQVGEIRDGLWRMRKLAPRPPHTLADVRVAKDGGLEGIRQFGMSIDYDLIPVDRLIGYVWDREGGNWVGRSMLRACYGDWLIKQTLLRVDVVKHQRNGMGIPIARATTPDPGTEALKAALDMAAAMRVGEQAAGALPYGTDVRLQGVEGSIPDVLASIRRCDEAMARRFLAMFLGLAQQGTGGHRALGEQFIDFFSLSLDTVGQWIANVTCEHGFEDWVDWNYGPGEDRVPLLVSERAEDEDASAQDIAQLVQAGALTVDAELEDAIRSRFKFPLRDPATPPPAPLAPAAKRRDEPRAGLKLPDRELRRDPTPAEAAAGVDFAALEQAWTATKDALVAAWQTIKGAQVAQLVDRIAQTTDLTELAQVRADIDGVELLTDHMAALAVQGAREAGQEAAHQGVTVAQPADSDLRAAVANRAHAVAQMLTDSLSQAAARRALASSGGTLTAREVADDVQTYLDGLSDAYLHDQLGGAATQAQNTGRRAVMDAHPPHRILASELLDAATCAACLTEDGTEWDTLAEAERHYPAGGYIGCLGGPRCRGTLVAIYDET